MSSSSNWPIPVQGYDSLRLMTKRLDRQARNASPISASDLLGPGMSSQAIHILDWNDEVATFNGFFYTTAGGLNIPVVQDDEGDDVADLPWIGTAIAREDGTGTHQVWNTDDPSSMYFRVRNWAPNPSDPNAPPIYGDWQRFATRSGFIAEEDLHPDVRDDIDNALADAEEALGLIIPPNYVFRQDDEPVSTDDHELQNYDIWFDTNDDDRMWVYFDGEWSDPTVEILSGASAAAATALANALDAAASAADAITIANGKNTTYRQTTEPTGGSYTTGDTWEDTDDLNKPYRWNGTDWVLGITGWVQTNATASRGVKITSAGLVTYADGTGSQPAGTATFTVNGATGDVTIIGDLAVGSTITGATVTGTLQTTTTASRGVKITSGGMVFYDLGGASVLTFSSSTGILSVTGPIVSGANISGSSITASSGGVIQSESTASRGIKMNSSGFTAYDGSGSPTFVITASTGAVVMKGSLSSGSTITGTTITGSSLTTSGTAHVEIGLSGFGGQVRLYNNSGVYGTVNVNSSDITFGGPSGGAMSLGSSGFQTDVITMDTLYPHFSSTIDVNGNFDMNSHTLFGVTTLTALAVSTVGVTASGTVAGATGSFSGDVTAHSFWMDTSVTTAGGQPLFEGASGLIRPNTSPSLAKWKRDVRPLDLDVDALAALGRGAISFRYRDDIDLPFGVDDFDETFHGISLNLAMELGGLDLLVGQDDEGEPFQFLERFLPISLLKGYGHDHERIDDIERRLAAAGI